MIAGTFQLRRVGARSPSISDEAEESVVEALADIVWVAIGDVRGAPGRAGTPASFTSPTSALRNSSMLSNRSRGSFCSDFITAAAMCGGTCGAKSRSCGASSSMCLAKSSPTPSAVNGGRPASISNSMTPSE